MATTMTAHRLFDDEGARPRTTRGQWLRRALTAVTGAAAVLLVGAVTMQLAAGALAVRTAPAFAILVAWAVALVAVVALPLWWSRNRRRAWRAADPLLRRPRVTWVLPWSVFLLLALPLFAPDLTRASLTTHGDWMVRGGPAVIDRGMHRATASVGRAIPTAAPLALTHRTEWPWVDRYSAECVGPVVAR